MTPLAQLRLRLTLWYAGVFTLILGLLGIGLFVAVRHQMSRQLDLSLEGATAAVMRAARIREAERAPQGAVVDAVEELHVPDRALYLFDDRGRPITPPRAEAWMQSAALEAARTGRADRSIETPADHVVRLHAERFTGASGAVYVAAAVADVLELESRYASLIRAFAAAALAALLLVAGGSYLLVRQSAAPVERSMDQMRRFMADAAHELRAPVTILRTRAEVALGQSRDSARDAVAFQAIEREATRLGQVVGDLLTLARADAGERPIAQVPLYLDDLAEQKHVQLEVGGFEEAKITGDPTLIRQLLLIVLDNAIKFTAAGGQVRLDVSAEDGRAAAVVADTGVGISPEHLPHVFERFFRGDPARHAADGAGLGLAIARWIAGAHGARIDISSTPGTGTRVTVSFPVVG